jgi:hypothetical protein
MMGVAHTPLQLFGVCLLHRVRLDSWASYYGGAERVTQKAHAHALDLQFRLILGVRLGVKSINCTNL